MASAPPSDGPTTTTTTTTTTTSTTTTSTTRKRNPTPIKETDPENDRPKRKRKINSKLINVDSDEEEGEEGGEEGGEKKKTRGGARKSKAKESDGEFSGKEEEEKKKKGKAVRAAKGEKGKGKGKGKKKKGDEEEEEGEEENVEEGSANYDSSKDQWVEGLNIGYFGFYERPIQCSKGRIVDAKKSVVDATTGFYDNKLFRLAPLGEKQETMSFRIIIELNITYLEKVITRGNRLHVADYDLILRIIASSLPSKQISLDVYNSALTIERTTPPPKQPSSVTKKMYKYQLEALSWMKELEERISSNEAWKYSTLVPWVNPKFNTNLFYDTQSQLLYTRPYQNANLTVHGGIYADQMGLGKTLVVGALISATSVPYKSDQWEVHTIEDETKQLESRATLILAPNHLCKQWQQEMESFKPPLKVLLITTKPQHEKLSYADFAKADAVIVSYQFLKNPSYTNIITPGQRYSQLRDTIIQLRTMEARRKKNLSSTKAPVLEIFKWRRIVLDEGHEVLHDLSNTFGAKKEKDYFLNIIDDITATFRWYVTGTPFANGTSNFLGALRFLRLKSPLTLTEIGNGSPNYPAWAVHDIIRQNLFWRNTKVSIGNEYAVPDVVEELRLMDMSDVERGLYRKAEESHDDTRMRQLCCHMQVSTADAAIIGVGKKTLDEVRGIMLDYQRKEIERISGKIDVQNREVAKSHEKLSHAVTADEKKWRRLELVRQEEILQSYRKELASAHASLTYFEAILPLISHSTSDPCPICLCDITRLTLTPCAHLFCKGCIEQCIVSTSKCPTCRKKISDTAELTEVVDKVQKEEIESKHELDSLIEKYGTKMAHLIHYLLNLFDEDDEARVIIFSQWDKMLHEIGSTLTENGISNVYCKGNVHVKNKAINIFKGNRRRKTKAGNDDDVRVMMLSLENAASGTNLTEASHIFLIDPVSGTAQHARDVEGQAIGRAHRQGQQKQLTVVRMIMKNTIEEDIYNRNQGRNQANFPRTNNLATIMAANPSLSRADSELLLAGANQEVPKDEAGEPGKEERRGSL